MKPNAAYPKHQGDMAFPKLGGNSLAVNHDTTASQCYFSSIETTLTRFGYLDDCQIQGDRQHTKYRWGPNSMSLAVPFFSSFSFYFTISLE